MSFASVVIDQILPIVGKCLPILHIAFVYILILPKYPFWYVRDKLEKNVTARPHKPMQSRIHKQNFQAGATERRGDAGQERDNLTQFSDSASHLENQLSYTKSDSDRTIIITHQMNGLLAQVQIKSNTWLTRKNNTLPVYLSCHVERYKSYVRWWWLGNLLNRSLHWRHNEPDGVSNHQPRHCLLNCLFRCRSKKTSKLGVTGLCADNSPGTSEFSAQKPVTRKMFPFDDVIMFSLLWCRWLRIGWNGK